MDTEQFEACWHAHIRRVVAYAERHVGRDAACDVGSSTFLTAWRTWDTVPHEPLPWLISVARGHVRPDASVTATERAEAIALHAAMPEHDREALLLVAWDGLTTEQAAEGLGCRPGTLRMRLHRARARIESSSTRPVLSIARSAQ